jgi:hypothetical protein
LLGRAQESLSFRQTKPAVSQATPQAVEIIGCEIAPFRAIVCFQWLDRGFVSPFFFASRSRRKLPNPPVFSPCQYHSR